MRRSTPRGMFQMLRLRHDNDARVNGTHLGGQGSSIFINLQFKIEHYRLRAVFFLRNRWSIYLGKMDKLGNNCGPLF